jgi:integrase
MAEKKIRGVYEDPAGSDVWHIQYFENGQRHREKVGKKSLAIKRYQIRKAEILEGRFFAPRGGRTIKELNELLIEDYKRSKQVLKPIETSWNRLKPYFEAARADSLTTEQIERYISKLAASGLSNATINRDLTALKRMFRLALRCTPPKAQRMPEFPQRLKEAPPRRGFVEDAKYNELLAGASEAWLKAFLAIAYRFGLRSREILNLRVYQVESDFIRLDPGTTKNDEGRIAPLTPEVRRLLAPCLAGKVPKDFIFTRGTKHVRDFRVTWGYLVSSVGVPELLVHDLRRSAVRNMIRRGIPERIAMAISGHKTRSIFDRYNIVAEGDILAAGRLLGDSPHAIGTATGPKRRKSENRQVVVFSPR